jgi:ubiquinone biosynthesis protein
MWELERTVMEEVDYRYEIANMKRMRKTLRQHRIRVPKVFGCSTSKILVMQFIPGVLMSDILDIGQREPGRLKRWLDINNVDLETVGKRLFLSFQRQVGEDNLFHGDLHPGNILLLRDSRVALIDFGSVGSLDPETVDLIGQYYRAIASQDFMTAADYTLLLMGRIPRMDPEEFRPQVARTFRSWLRRSRVEGLSYKEKAFSEASIEVSRLIARHKVLVGWEFMRVNRATVTLEASLRFLQPNADQARLMSKHMRGLEARRRKRLWSQIREQFANIPHELAFVADLQERILRNRGRAIQAAMSKASRAAAALFGALEIAAAATLALVVLPRPAWIRPPAVLDALPTLLTLAVALAVFLFARTMRRFVKLPDVKP